MADRFPTAESFVEHVIDMHGRDIFARIYSKVNRTNHADDVNQAVLRSIFERYDKYRNKTDDEIRSFVFFVVKCRICDLTRGNTKNREHETEYYKSTKRDSQPAQIIHDPENNLQNRLKKARIQKKITDLEADTIRHFINGMTPTQIAKHYGVAVTTVRRRIENVSRKLREDPASDEFLD